MISDGLRRQIELALWPRGDSTPGSLWAILDCARDRRIYRELVVSRLDYRCLYSGNLAPELKAVAPHMVELSPRYSFTSKLLEQCWGNSWGVFVRLNDGTRLRHHLLKLLTVRTEAGRKLLFRYYDPRVLRVYLPTCRKEELAAVFGPIDKLFCEDSLGLESFEFDGSELVRRSLLVAASGTEPLVSWTPT